jgi:N-acetylglucosaminyldiphosphoundecaprenol N-acetyl-beta-D-mannosaminyltransferase
LACEPILAKQSTKIRDFIMTVQTKVNICGTEIDRYSFDEVVEKVKQHVLSSTKPEYIVTPNADHILKLQKDPLFQKVYQHAFLVVPDGVSMLWAASFLGTPLKGRVNGTDLFERLCDIAEQEQFKVFFLGGLPGAAEGAADVLKNRHPALSIVGTYRPPIGQELEAAESARTRSIIQAAKPDLLFVGFGAPRQEYWMYANYQEIAVPISIGIGGSFDVVSGMISRSPKWMQRAGLEWLFRLMAEPRRLWKRYILGNPLFLYRVFQQRFDTLSNKESNLVK